MYDEIIFITYNFSVVDVDIFFYQVGPTLQSLNCTKSYMQSKKNRREYCHVCTHPSFISLDEPLMINSDQCMRLKLILPK